MIDKGLLASFRTNLVTLSSRQSHADWRRNHFSFAASLEALQSVERTAKVSVDSSFIPENLVKCIAIRNGMLSNGSFHYTGPSQHSQRFEKLDCICQCRNTKIPRPHFRK